MHRVRLWWSQLNKLMSVPVPDLSTLSDIPIVVILGSTATGKSKLAIDLASKFGGEIISADSMQVYKGLDILTNKAQPHEMKGIPHHMIGVVDRKEKFDVIHFRDHVLPLVEKTMESKKLPVIVGGTNYYIESILWKVLIGGQGNESLNSGASRKRKAGFEENVSSVPFLDIVMSNPILKFFYDNGGMGKESDVTHWKNLELYSALQLIDPERLSKLHPNDRRKVFRSLQVRFQTGRKHSELIAEQCLPLAGDFGCDDEDEGKDGTNSGDDSGEVKLQQINSATALGGPLRFSNCFCLWIQADKNILHKRIEDRVDSMVGQGLKQELDSYMDILRKENEDLNYEEGILQSIGFKEFHSYLQLMPTERESEEAEKLFNEGLERLKVVTKQYAKKQLKWINQRFLRPSRRQVPPVYRLDGNSTEESDWEKNVTSVAINIVEAHLNNQLESPILKERVVVCTSDKTEDDLIARTCEICENRIFIGNNQWEIHMKSIRHRKMVKRKTTTQKNYNPNLSKNTDDEEPIGASQQQ